MTTPPRRRPFLTADWRHLVMVNYAVDPDILAPYVPRGTKIDLWNHQCLVSVVGFLFNRLSLFGRLPVPCHESFEEVNLRFYVTRQADQETRRGVVFIKEVAPSRSVAWLANRWFDENYLCLPMRHTIAWKDPKAHEQGGVFDYQWQMKGHWSGVQATTQGSLSAVVPSSIEEFITEHYWGYSKKSDGTTLEYQVDHRPWNVWKVRTCRLDADTHTLYGPSFVDPLLAEPHSALVADGSPVAVYRGVPVGASRVL